MVPRSAFNPYAAVAEAPLLETAHLLPVIFEWGYARVTLDRRQTAALKMLRQLSASFFAQSFSDKQRHSVPDLSVGYRAPKSSHSGNPDAPNLNESFLYWSARENSIPGCERISGWLGAIERCRRLVAAPIAAKLVMELCAHYGYAPGPFGFQRASVMQLNAYKSGGGVEWQGPHDDLTFATVLCASAPGLVGMDGEQEQPLTPDFNEALIFPGGILTLMTDGEIPPLIHSVVDAGQADRCAEMYFVNPNIDAGKIAPFVVGKSNVDVDIGERIKNSVDAFGLSQNFFGPEGEARKAQG